MTHEVKLRIGPDMSIFSPLGEVESPGYLYIEGELNSSNCSVIAKHVCTLEPGGILLLLKR